MKLQRCILLSFCFLLSAVAGFAQSGGQTPKTPSVPGQRTMPPLVPIRPTQGKEQSTDDGKSDSPFFKGKARFLTLRRDVKGTLLAGTKSKGALANLRAATKTSAGGEAEANEHMPFWQGSFNFLGASFPFRMIGTDPAKGSATTRVPVTIIPVQITFGDGSQLSATQTACGDTQSSVSRIMESPLFQDFSFTVGGTFIGNTQYMDAFQRANFWTDVRTKSPDYHVLLSPSVGPLASITGVPNPFVSFTVQGPCAPVGFEEIGDFDPQVQTLIDTLHIPQGTLPVFVMYNTFLTQNGACCILGYHSVTFDTNLHPYMFASYSDPNLFNKPIEDIHALSHELGEWMDDPFIHSFVPSWGNVGQVGGCSFSLETGDAVTGTAFEATLNGFTYHPEDLVFLPWFARETPSSSVNGQYTFLNSFAQPRRICGQ